MALYYFDMRLDGAVRRDEHGDAFDSIEDAVAQAQALVNDLTPDHPLREGGTAACEVRDDQGRVRYRAEITFRGERF